MSKKISYKEAFEEIEEIIANIEAGNYDIDVLAEKVKRVSCLANICREKLKNAEDETRALLKETESEE